jgi:phage tail sheath protein FI
MGSSFQLRPGVQVSEIDLTNRIPTISVSAAGYVGAFKWGPVLEVVTIDSEKTLVKKFGKPDNDSGVSFLNAANFLSYSNKLRLVRVVDAANAKNSTANGAGLLIRNEEHYTNSYAAGQGAVGNWAGKYAGTLGNSLKVSICSTATAFNSRALAGTVSTTGTAVTGIGTAFNTALTVGDYLIDASGNRRLVSAIGGATTATLKSAFAVDLAGATCTALWEFSEQFSAAPGTSDYAAARSMVSDECHVVVSDEGGLWTGVQGQILEKYPFLSLCGSAKNDDGTSNFYSEVLNRLSEYVWWMDHDSAGTNWGSTTNGTTLTAVNIPVVSKLTGGVESNSTVDDADKIEGYELFLDDSVDVSILIGGVASATVAIALIDDIAEVRKDLVVCLSPEQADVVNNAGAEVTDAKSFRNSVSSSSYSIIDSNWFYCLDRYNDTYRWVPCNPCVAGCIVQTDMNRQPWFSPAGIERGGIKNCIKLAYQATKAEQEDLYQADINPVVVLPGQGTILFGDKTMLGKPSAFDRINVRRLFIILEKAIARAAHNMLFELNDDFTRSQFRHMVEPYLRDVKSQRGLYDFYVVCDNTNNTSDVIDRNEFVGDIYLKPSRSINFIRLNFVAVGSGVSFSEVVGQF